ncbi:synaptic vesicle transporter, partial [Aureobasidium melanogenum]
MQSLRQYKQLRQAVQRQLERDTVKAKALSAYTQQYGLEKREEAQVLGGQPLEKVETPGRDEEANDDEEALDAIAEDEMEDSYPQADNQNELNRIHTSRSHHADLTKNQSEDADLSRIPTHRTHYSERTALGYSMTGINARLRATNESENGHVFVVEWEGPHDPLKPHNWSTGKRMWATIVVSLVAVAGTAASSIDAAVLPQYSEYFHVSEVAGSLATAMYLIGFAVGSQFAGPFSETFGRNIIYIVTMFIYMLFLLGCALAPNFGGHITLRFFAGLFGSTPLTVAGGTIADLWNPLEKTFGFP